MGGGGAQAHSLAAGPMYLPAVQGVPYFNRNAAVLLRYLILQNERGFQPSADRITEFLLLPFLHHFHL